MGHFGPYPYQPFPKPVSPVPEGETQEICFRFDEKWLPYLLACVKALVVKRTWESDQDRCVGEASQVLTALMLATSDCMPTITDGHDCVEFSPNAPFIEYFPTNPYFQADALPQDYLRTPWVIWTPALPGIPFLSAQAGDVFTGFYGNVISPDLDNELFPRIRVHVSGPGVVELHLLKLPAGGAAVITVDDDLGTAQFIELQADILAVPPEWVITEIIEVETTGDGPHFIDIRFTPRLAAEIPPISLLGGGLRKVVLCGFPIDAIQDVVTRPANYGGVDGEDNMIRQNPDNPCELQTSINGIDWCTFADFSLCVAGAPGGQPGGGSPQPEPGGGQACYDARMPANSKWLMPTTVNAGDVITVSDPIGAAYGGATLIWNCPDGSTFFAGSCVPSSGAVQAGSPIPALPYMRLIMKISGVYYDALAGPVTVPVGVANAQVEFQVNDSALSDNAGEYTFKACRTNNSVVRFTHHFDFRISTWNFQIHNYGGNSNAVWIAGEGFKAVASAPIAAGDGAIYIGLNNGIELTNAVLRIVGSRQGTTNNCGVFEQLSDFPPPNTGQSWTTVPAAGAVDFSHAFTVPLHRFAGLIETGAIAGQISTFTDFYVTADGDDPF